MICKLLETNNSTLLRIYSILKNLAYLLFTLACLQRFHHVVFICLHVRHLHWSLIFVTAELVSFKTHYFKLIIKTILKVRIFESFTRFTLFNDSSTDFPDHFDEDITDSNTLMIVADQFMNKSMFSIIFLGAVSPIGSD